jgi:hypothetical protein
MSHRCCHAARHRGSRHDNHHRTGTGPRDNEPGTIATTGIPGPRAAPVGARFVALGASGLLAVSVLTPDRGQANVDTSRTVAQYGSITAIEHRDELALLRQQAQSRTVAEHGSVAAADHRDGVTLRGQDAPSRTVAEHGSIAAIEHRDEQAQLREAASRTVAEYGSVAAIEHRDEAADR